MNVSPKTIFLFNRIAHYQTYFEITFVVIYFCKAEFNLIGSLAPENVGFHFHISMFSGQPHMSLLQ